MRWLEFTIVGYLLGSILFGELFLEKIKKIDIRAYSDDSNPGTANAYKLGGFWCGTLTLLGDVMKGFLPVFCYLWIVDRQMDATCVFVIIAPVVGHAYSLFHRFNGGKAIAVTFGCLLGLFPFWIPLVTLAFYFLFYSLVFKISPHGRRTIVTFVSTSVTDLFFVHSRPVLCAVWCMTGIVCQRHMKSHVVEGNVQEEMTKEEKCV